MRKRVNFSTYSTVITVLSIVILAGVLFVVFSDPESSLVTRIGVVVIVLLFCLSGLFYAPLAISVDGDALCVERPLRRKVIPLADIADVRLCKPTMAERRLCGSGSFLGHWGRMYERDLGRYFAYYGKASDCFLVTLNDRRKYMLGCKDAPEMVAAIKKTITPRR